MGRDTAREDRASAGSPSNTSAPSLPKPPSSEPKPALQPEPTIKFLFTLLNTSEPKDPEEGSEAQECPFLDEEDWGPQRTSKEISHLRDDCLRVWESLSRTKVDNKVLGEKLQNLPSLLYHTLKLEEETASREETQVSSKETQAGQEAVSMQEQQTCSQPTALVVLLPNPRHDHRSYCQQSRQLLGEPL